MSITSSSTRDECIMQLLAAFTPHIQKAARDWHADYDDFYQEAAVHICTLVNDQTVARADLARFANRLIRCRLIDRGKYLARRRMQSLDIPIDEGARVGDVLPSGYSVDPATVYATRERLQALCKDVDRLTRKSALRSQYETVLASYC